MQRPNRDDGFLLAAAAGYAPAASAQDRVGPARPDGGLAQDQSQVAVAVTGGAGALRAGLGRQPDGLPGLMEAQAS